MDDAPRYSSVPSPEGALFAQRFEIEKQIGSGGMSFVYAAFDRERSERVALKVLRLPEKKRELGLERFRRETETLRRLVHPGVVAIYDCGVEAEITPWISMELLEGETLREKVERVGSLELDRLVAIVETASEALHLAHTKGVVHRDLKPDNLFLPRDPSGSRVKIIDFGLSLSADAKKLTQTGSVVGTPRYMAPEQIMSAHSTDPRVDVYSLGVIAYEALAGKSPFAASDHGQLLGAIIQGRIEPLEAIRPDLPKDIVRVIERATAPDPSDRYESPIAFAAALKKAAEGRPVTYREIRRPDRSSRPSYPSSPGTLPAPRVESGGVGLSPIGWALLVVGLAAAGAGITYLALHAL